MNVIRLTVALVMSTALFGHVLLAQDTNAMQKAPAMSDTTEMEMETPMRSASDVSVEAVVARTVVDRMPQDSGTAFPPDVGQLVLWTRVSGAAGQPIHHVWFHGDTEVGRVELQVGGSPWRTWSTKTVPSDWTGAWHVEVRDEAGHLAKRIDFTVG